jgi:hypothetical protein
MRFRSSLESGFEIGRPQEQDPCRGALVGVRAAARTAARRSGAVLRGPARRSAAARPAAQAARVTPVSRRG